MRRSSFSDGEPDSLQRNRHERRKGGRRESVYRYGQGGDRSEGSRTSSFTSAKVSESPDTLFLSSASFFFPSADTLFDNQPKKRQNEPRTQGTKKGRADIYPDGPPLLRRTPSPSTVQEREHISLQILWIRPFRKCGTQWREEEGQRKAHQVSDDQRHPLRLLHGRDVLVGLQLADCKARQGHREKVSLQGPQREDPASESEGYSLSFLRVAMWIPWWFLPGL